MPKVESFKQLEVWQQAVDLATAIYQLTRRFPVSEQFGLTAQMRRAAVSVASNIAEGHRRTRPAYINHLQIALGSLAELETQVILAERVHMCRAEEVEPVQDGVAWAGRMPHSLLKSLRE